MGRAPEWRQDPLTERLVLISPERAERPLHPGPSCPFCEGHESETPPEVLTFRDSAAAPNGPGWRVRVVPNRYAAVRPDGASSPLSASERGAGGERFPGAGVAEVFIECPQHETKFRNLSREQITDVLRAWHKRLRLRRDDPRVAYAQVFKNEGAAAGASVEHCHSQLIGISFVPPEVAKEAEHLEKLRIMAGVCPYCRWIAAGSESNRFVTQSSHFAVFCPTAPRFPGEMWLLPKPHGHAFHALSEDSLPELAGILIDVLTRMDGVFGAPAFNLIVKSAPYSRLGNFHWRIEILPRTTTTAGWEWGTGLQINTMFPEDAAHLLREPPAA
jgi:UDPglucose--hexose-1-phosphate uridylyltransferase